jgi:hypothetical protein
MSELRLVSKVKRTETTDQPDCRSMTLSGPDTQANGRATGAVPLAVRAAQWTPLRIGAILRS